jgi:hypothetical protein
MFSLNEVVLPTDTRIGVRKPPQPNSRGESAPRDRGRRFGVSSPCVTGLAARTTAPPRGRPSYNATALLLCVERTSDVVLSEGIRPSGPMAAGAEAFRSLQPEKTEKSAPVAAFSLQ